VAKVIGLGDPTRAAIAGSRAANIYGGKVLQHNLEDHTENYTRFVLLSPTTTPGARADKLSIVMKLPHKAGALYRALQPFADRGIDLLKIESRPIKGRAFEYHFYLDLQASTNDERVIKALAELGERATEVRVLGCYQAGSR
jgi:prephenate dehydratase/chorismate mutase/prephenate dehydratase